MKKQLMVTFDYRERGEDDLKTYSKPIEFPDEPPIAFLALYQMATHVHWAQKNVLKARIEKLENALEFIASQVVYKSIDRAQLINLLEDYRDEAAKALDLDRDDEDPITCETEPETKRER